MYEQDQCGYCGDFYSITPEYKENGVCSTHLSMTLTYEIRYE